MEARRKRDRGIRGGAPAGRQEAPDARSGRLPGGPSWRALLEARWQDRLHKVTELSLAFHDAEETAQPHPSARSLRGDSGGRPPGQQLRGDSGGRPPGQQLRGDSGGRPPGQQLRQLMRRATAARRELADIDEALGRLTVGRFGQCEQCSEPIPQARLLRVPEDRYCPRCV